MTQLNVTLEGHTFRVAHDWTPQQGGQLTIQVDGEPVEVILPGKPGDLENIAWLIVNGRPYEIDFDRDLAWLRTDGGRHPLELRDLEAQILRPPSGDKRVKAPIPGLIVRLLVVPGQDVEAGQPVAVLEAMKMENEIHAGAAGTVRQIHVGAGQTVRRGDVLVEFA